MVRCGCGILRRVTQADNQTAGFGRKCCVQSGWEDTGKWGCGWHGAYLWDVATGEQKGTITGYASEVSSVAFSPDGRYAGKWGGNGAVHLWDRVTGRHKRTLAGHTDWVRSVAFSPDGKTLASGGGDETIRFWDVVRQVNRRGQSGIHLGSVV